MGETLQFKPFTAPYRFCFIDPDTGREFKAKTKKELFKQIIDYRSQNSLAPIQALDTVVENYLCNLPENVGNCQPIKLKRGWLRVLKGGVAVFENILFQKMVSPEVAEARAVLCLKCPHNVFPDKTGFQAWSDEIAENATDGRQVKDHDKLGNCQVCSCTLKAKVWFDGPMGLTPKDKAEMSKVDCWQTKES